jgi:phage tail sheath protein FI
MPQYFTPGVYVEEIERGPRPIEGVPTSIAAFLGESERGTTTPHLVTSYIEYKRWFGDVFGNRTSYLPYAANGFFENGGKQLYVCRLTRATAVSASLALGNDYVLTATGGGTWGNRVYAVVGDSKTRIPDPAAKADAKDPTKPVGFSVKVAYWSDAIDTTNGPPYDPFSDDPSLSRNKVRPTLIEVFDDLVTDPASSDYWEKRLNGNSALVELKFKDPTKPTTANPTAATAFLKGGKDFGGGTNDHAALDVTDYQGDKNSNPPRDEEQGLAALDLDPYRDVSLLYAPSPPDSKKVNMAIINYCELKRFRFAVVDPQSGTDDTGKLDPRVLFTDTEYAALYFPWVYIADPQNGATKLVPPGGYALGVMARVDTERGVYKAPANEIPRGVVDLEFNINDDKQATLNPQGCNVIRDFAGRGIRVWGARTMSSNALWKYISVRRLFIFLERSIYEGTQWVVFEPNDDRLWARVKDTIRLFLRTQWREGALFGRTEDEAFFITCDRTTMTQEDILNGRLICEIGIAPVRPAEFVIFRVFQQTAEAQR